MTKELSTEQLYQQLAALQAQVDALKNDKADMQQQIDLLVSQLNLNQSRQFGKKSEKTPRGTFNEAEQIKAEQSRENLLSVIDAIADAVKEGFLDNELKKVKGPVRIKATSKTQAK